MQCNPLGSFSERVCSFPAFLPNDIVIYDDPHLIYNTVLTLPVDKHIFILSCNTGLPLTYTWEHQGSTGGDVGSVHSSSPASSSVENWEIGRARKCQDVPLKGICERWDQLKFHLTLIFLYHCSTKKCASSMYAILVLSDSDFYIPSIKCCILWNAVFGLGNLMELNSVLMEKIVADIYLQSAYL